MQERNTTPTLPPLRVDSLLSHFTIMMGPHGLFQHATIREPLLSEGYCTDDNARAIQMLVRLTSLVSSNEKLKIREFFERCWQFLREAQIRPGYFYNFRDAKGKWLPQGTAESEDMYARIIRALAEVLRSSKYSNYHNEASTMLQPLRKRAADMRAPRFRAEYLIATEDMLNADTKASLALVRLWEDNASNDWLWFEPTMTYANALFPHGLLCVLKNGLDEHMEAILHNSAQFLIHSTIRDGIFIPIGSNGWYPKGGKPSSDNQQAIEAGTMLDFLIDYQAAYPDKVHKEDIAAVYFWFFGKNTNEIVMADEETGACLDGIFLSGPNLNNGAESMLAYQWAEIRIREASQNIQQFVAAQKLLTVA